MCRDARLVRPLYQRLQHRGFNGDGRTDRASLHRATCLVPPSLDYSCDPSDPLSLLISNPLTLPITLIKKDLAEVRRIIAVGRRGKAPNDPRTLDAS